MGDPARHLVPDEALPLFMTHCNKRIGEAYFRTPRNTIKAFVQLLAVLEQNPGQGWSELIGGVDVANREIARAITMADPGPAIVIHGEGWPTGVVGIVAAKLVDKYQRPAFCTNDERSRWLCSPLPS